MAGLLKVTLFASLALLGATSYAPTWESLDTRPLPEWYDEAKIGIFIHWGVFSVPSFESAWFWYRWIAQELPQNVRFMKDNYPPSFTYADFAPQFTAEFFDPKQWANIFKAAGAKYVVLTSKHHEGFTNWPSNNSWNWNSMDVGPKKDLVGALSEAIRTNTPDLHFGLYHSLYEWFNPLYLSDKAKDYQTNEFVRYKTMPELYDLVNTYHPEIVWSDGDWEAQDWYWNSTVFLAWLFNESPVKDTVVVNDRWGKGILCQHGSYYTCHDRYNPGVLQPHKWENAMTVDSKAWTYRRDAVSEDFLTIQQLITEVVTTVSCGGNILINVGPTPDGRIAPIMEERLRQLGSWLGINGDGIYKTKPWVHQNDTASPGVWYTSNGEITYAFILNWPEDGFLILGSATSTANTTVTMMGYEGNLQFTAQTPGMKIIFPDMSKVTSQWTWLLALSGIRPV